MLKYSVEAGNTCIRNLQHGMLQFICPPVMTGITSAMSQPRWHRHSENITLLLHIFTGCRCQSKSSFICVSWCTPHSVVQLSCNSLRVFVEWPTSKVAATSVCPPQHSLFCHSMLNVGQSHIPSQRHGTVFKYQFGLCLTIFSRELKTCTGQPSLTQSFQVYEIPYIISVSRLKTIICDSAGKNLTTSSSNKPSGRVVC